MSISVKELGLIQRAGVKGPQAEPWLVSQGLPVPIGVNTWAALEGGRVLRLGRGEFLIEGHSICDAIAAAPQPIGPGLYKVARADACFEVGGNEALELLAELCLLDLRAQALADNAVVMTQLGGVSATLVRDKQEGRPVYRIWCDGTYAEFMREALHEIAHDLD
jgi:sarcosine oxidase subunit gamma